MIFSTSPHGHRQKSIFEDSKASSGSGKPGWLMAEHFPLRYSEGSDAANDGFILL